MSDTSTGFFQGSFANAKRQAKKSNRPMVVDFFTDWCPPCKMLDENTWPDQEVQEFLNSEVVAIKINADSNMDLAQEYAIEAYPSILFFDATGKELDRLVGYVEPAEFLEEARGVLSGKDGVERARAKLVGDKANSPMMHMQLARKLKDKDRHAEALAEYLWCYDQGEMHEPAFEGVRLSFLLTEIAELGKVHGPARDALIERRDDARGIVLSTPEEGDVIGEFAALNNALGEMHDTVLMYDTLRARRGVPDDVMTTLFEAAMPGLLEQKRYDDILEGAGSLDDMFKTTLEGMVETMPPEEQQIPPEMMAMFRSFMMVSMARYYEPLLGTGQIGKADAWCERILASDAHPMTFMSLIQSARRANVVAKADALLARAKEEMSAENYEQLMQDLAAPE